MAFNPFESKYAKAIMPKVCKGKSLKTFGKTFEEVVNAKVSEPNYEIGGVSIRLGEECIALAEIVAVARGAEKRGLEVPVAANQWLQEAPEFDDELAATAKAAIDKVRTQSASWAIVEEMGGWPEWTNYCRGLSTRLGKPAKKRKLREPADNTDLVAFLQSIDCHKREENGQLIRLDLHGDRPVSDDDLDKVIQFNKLKELSFARQDITDAGISKLSALKQLERLSLFQCDKVKGKGFAKLKSPPLKHFRIRQKDVDTALANCGQLSKIQSLELNTSGLSDRGIQSLAKLSNLNSINAKDTKITDAGLKPLGNLPKLESLCLDECKRVKGVGLAHLHGLKKLRHLSAGRIAFSRAGFEALLGLTSLRHLELKGSKIPAKQLASLTQLKSLESLEFWRLDAGDDQLEFLAELRRLKSLNLNACEGVTDRLLTEVISQLPNLEHLSISNTPITKAAEKTLAGMTRLKSLSVFQTGLPRAAQKRLAKIDEDDPNDDDR